mmetsp:Transcript_5465/g.15529  ORF Transcript_5465/g.15529 Transcript_5465/m.15529 type:complete len:265 (+) Transcript_5465:878-1672(+)
MMSTRRRWMTFCRTFTMSSSRKPRRCRPLRPPQASPKRATKNPDLKRRVNRQRAKLMRERSPAPDRAPTPYLSRRWKLTRTGLSHITTKTRQKRCLVTIIGHPRRLQSPTTQSRMLQSRHAGRGSHRRAPSITSTALLRIQSPSVVPKRLFLMDRTATEAWRQPHSVSSVPQTSRLWALRCRTRSRAWTSSRPIPVPFATFPPGTLSKKESGFVTTRRSTTSLAATSRSPAACGRALVRESMSARAPGTASLPVAQRIVRTSTI